MLAGVEGRAVIGVQMKLNEPRIALDRSCTMFVDPHVGLDTCSNVAAAVPVFDDVVVAAADWGYFAAAADWGLRYCLP
jgi:hypothetical protein